MINSRLSVLIAFSTLILLSCNSSKQEAGVPTVGFIEAFEDATIADAKKGFLDALREQGFSEKDKTVNILAKNAQGDINTMNQIVNFMQSRSPDCMGTSTTVSTLATVQRMKDTPIFMCVTAMPEILGLTDKNHKSPQNLYGVGEDLNYIDTSFNIISHTVKPQHGDHVRIGMIYNQAEQQSVDAYERLAALAEREKVDLIALPLNSSADAQLVVRSLLTKQIDAFFANPDNTVFAAFETIVKNCDARQVPVFTSEVGLVQRGAVAAYGADIYQWGYQAGLQAANYLKHKDKSLLKLEKVKVRKKVYNPKVAERYHFAFQSDFEALK